MKFVNLLKENLLNFYTIRVLIIWIIGIILMYFNLCKNLFGLTLLFMLINISLIGFIMTYIYPKYFYFPINNYYIKDKELYIVDLLFHHLPLISHLILLKINFWSFNKNLIPYAILINLLFFEIYILQINPFNIYIKK
jgi:hypothetical protein